jgi:hypothetical protein
VQSQVTAKACVRGALPPTSAPGVGSVLEGLVNQTAFGRRGNRHHGLETVDARLDHSKR